MSCVAGLGGCSASDSGGHGAPSSRTCQRWSPAPVCHLPATTDHCFMPGKIAVLLTDTGAISTCQVKLHACRFCMLSHRNLQCRRCASMECSLLKYSKCSSVTLNCVSRTAIKLASPNSQLLNNHNMYAFGTPTSSISTLRASCS